MASLGPNENAPNPLPDNDPSQPYLSSPPVTFRYSAQQLIALRPPYSPILELDPIHTGDIPLDDLFTNPQRVRFASPS